MSFPTYINVELLAQEIASKLGISNVNDINIVMSKYGIGPAMVMNDMLKRGATFLAKWYSYPMSGYINVFKNDVAVIDGVESGLYSLTISCHSTSSTCPPTGIVSYIYFDISKYEELLIMCGLIPLGDGRGPHIFLGNDLDNYYHVGVDINLSAQDFFLHKFVGGTGLFVAYEAINLALSEEQPVAWYYKRSEGRHVVWRRKSLKFDVVDTDIDPQYLGFLLNTCQTSKSNRKISCPIIILAL